MKRTFCLLLLLVTLCSAVARHTEDFNIGWTFARFGRLPDGSFLREPIGLSAECCDADHWRSVDLPHDWGIEGPFLADLPGDTAKLPWAGIGWYRKTFKAPASATGQHVWLEIDGAMASPTVFINGSKVEEWKYGYASFRADLTSHLRYDSFNTVAIRLENPADSSRWYPGSGLYRDVRILYTAQVAVDEHGVFVRTPYVTDAKATALITTDLRNDSELAVAVVVRHRIISPVGREVDVVETLQTPLAAGGKCSVEALATIPEPALWAVSTPLLYRCETEVFVDGAEVDAVTTHFGVRSIAWSASSGLLLNERPVVLQGVCQHHDLGALGAAFNLRAAERQLEILRAMGCNAIRTSHNPPAPALLDLCDRMGFLVVDEVFDGWRKPKTPNDYGKHFDAWHERDIRAWVRRDRNHPSVIAWSIGNEVLEQKPPEKYPDAPALVRHLRQIVRGEDASRAVTAACDHPKTAWTDFARELDWYGFNYKPMYYGRFASEYPSQPFYGSETASTVSTRGEYFFPVSEKRDGGFFNYQVSSYDLFFPPWAQKPDTEFAAQDANPGCLGEFVWTGFDYLGEPTPYGGDASVLLNFTNDAERESFKRLMESNRGKSPARSSYFGIVDLAGFPKDRYYMYQARWRPDHPMAHILPHWTWPGREGEVTPVHVYTSGDEAELFLNGASLGRKKRAAGEYRLRWDEVKYTPGELKVVAYRNGKPWAEAVKRTAGEVVALEVTADRAKIAGDGRDLSFVTVRAVDSRGELVPDASVKFDIAVSGAGEYVASDNGNPIDHRTFSKPFCDTFHGLALVILRGKPGANGEATLRVISKDSGIAPVEIKISVTAPARPAGE